MNRRPIDREALILRTASRTILIQHKTSGSTHALVSWTGKVLVVHYGVISGGFHRCESVYLDVTPGLHDGVSWNLQELIYLMSDR